MRPIKLVYWKTKIDNYGDLLSPYIVGKLSGREIIKKNYFVGNWKSHIYHLLQSIRKLDWDLRVPYLFPFEKAIVGIGSILSKGNRQSLIWGSGFMSANEVCTGGKIFAIRGYKSLALVQSQKENNCKITIDANIAIGDPALLLPLILPLKIRFENTIGIIPHFSETNFFKTKYGSIYNIIDLRSSDIEKVTRQILSNKLILSTSLHGLIVAHAYGIPALWVEYTGLEKGTNGFKFKDYFSSVGIKEYEPLRNIDKLLSQESIIVQQFEKYASYALPVKDLSIIQHKLLKNAPFRIIEKYGN